MNHDVREIESITFGIFSTEQILAMSVCKIDSSKLGSIDKISGSHGTVYDSRMGTIENDKECETCNQDVWSCIGHFGHIELNEPIIHPLFYTEVTAYLSCFCINCSKLLINHDQVFLTGLNRFSGNKRFDKILEKLKKVDICCHCHHPQPEIKFIKAESNIAMVYKQKNKSKLSIIMSVDEIKKTFENIDPEDVRILGFDPENIHPKNYIISVFPVMPPCCRPYVIADGNICDDDLTNQLVEIIKANNHLSNKNGTPVQRQKYLNSIKFRISTFYNNSSGKAKHTTNGRAIKGIKERLTGKGGILRTNLMGKRGDQSGRTVIGPDPTLKLGQIAFPPHMASILTVPVQVTDYNLEEMRHCVNTGGANFVLKDGSTDRKINLQNFINFRGTRLLHGDIVIRGDEEFVVNNGKQQLKDGDQVKRDGEWLENLKYPQTRKYHLNVGDIVERKLIDGDILLLNRQPTLHKGSMMAVTVVIRPGKTIRMNLSITKSYNADFDRKSVENRRP